MGASLLGDFPFYSVQSIRNGIKLRYNLFHEYHFGEERSLKNFFLRSCMVCFLYLFHGILGEDVILRMVSPLKCPALGLLMT